MSPEQLEQKPYNHKVGNIHISTSHQLCPQGGYLQSGFDIPGAVGTHHNWDGAHNGSKDAQAKRAL